VKNQDVIITFIKDFGTELDDYEKSFDIKLDAELILI